MFLEERLACANPSSSYGDEFAVQVTETLVNRYAVLRHPFKLSRFSMLFGNQTIDDQIEKTIDIFSRIGGMAGGFRLRNYNEFSSNNYRETPTNRDHPLEQVGPDTYYLTVWYGTPGSEAPRRRVKKPVDGTVVMSIYNGSTFTPTVDFTIDPVTGIVTIGSPLSSFEFLYAGFLFDIPVMFLTDMSDIEWQGADIVSTSINLIETFNPEKPMKPVIAPYARPLYAMRIVCANGTIVRIAEFPYDVEIGGNLYRSDAGYKFTGMQSGTAFTPGSIDLESLIGISPEITLANIQSGVFNSARVFLFCTDWAAPIEDEEEITQAIFGKVRVEDNKYRVEVMQLINMLNTTVGDTYSALCSLEFGGQDFGGCKVDLGPLEVVSTLTSVTDNYVFADSTLSEDDDYFGAGKIEFLTGVNAGIAAQRVKDFTNVGGVIEVNEPFPFTPNIGDQYRMLPGCRKRLEDCRDKWENVPRRRAFDFVPGIRFLNKIGGTD